ncbi:hypothetical protein GCM10025864_35940 [Luteimicrobium album]|uniref:Uncharacterized protein n=1 Tax=Luteimicrobium album TaxID=1054550 RepID=A0ABQ6I5R8_9MICO|nr:hypothetical protein [Luteimicrobium album]GMA25835.1 hypothetical protein GCM10025864_35940 [Luteimicrobium album]
MGRVDDVELVHAEGKMALQAALEIDGLSPATAGRRADCMESWANQTQAVLSAGIAAGSAHLGDTLQVAVLRAGEQRSASRQAVRERAVRLCPTHSTQLSNSGVCDACELDG